MEHAAFTTIAVDVGSGVITCMGVDVGVDVAGNRMVPTVALPVGNKRVGVKRVGVKTTSLLVGKTVGEVVAVGDPVATGVIAVTTAVAGVIAAVTVGVTVDTVGTKVCVKAAGVVAAGTADAVNIGVIAVEVLVTISVDVAATVCTATSVNAGVAITGVIISGVAAGIAVGGSRKSTEVESKVGVTVAKGTCVCVATLGAVTFCLVAVARFVTAKDSVAVIDCFGTSETPGLNSLDSIKGK